MTGKTRRLRIKRRLRAEGSKAFLEGKSRVAPQKYQNTMDEYQWLRGYDEASWDQEIKTQNS